MSGDPKPNGYKILQTIICKISLSRREPHRGSYDKQYKKRYDTCT